MGDKRTLEGCPVLLSITCALHTGTTDSSLEIANFPLITPINHPEEIWQVSIGNSNRVQSMPGGRSPQPVELSSRPTWTKNMTMAR
jgi:hypothetical protein